MVCKECRRQAWPSQCVEAPCILECALGDGSGRRRMVGGGVRVGSRSPRSSGTGAVVEGAEKGTVDSGSP